MLYWLNMSFGIYFFTCKTSCCTLFGLHFFCVAHFFYLILFSCCTFSRIAFFSCCTFFSKFFCVLFLLWFFMLHLFSCYTLFVFHVFRVVLFSRYTLFMLHFFRIAFFSCCTFFSKFFCVLFLLWFFMLHLFSCCTHFMLQISLVVLFSHYTFPGRENGS